MNSPYFSGQMGNQQQGNMIPNIYPYQETTDAYQRRLVGMAQQFSGQNNGMGNAFQQSSNLNTYNSFANSQGIVVRAVTGYEEAMASQIPLDGSISIFTDFSHGNIYTKQLNVNDGTALIKTYKLGENPVSSMPSVENSVKYVEKEEFDELKGRFNEIWDALTDKKPQIKSEKKESK